MEGLAGTVVARRWGRCWRAGGWQYLCNGDLRLALERRRKPVVINEMKGRD